MTDGIDLAVFKEAQRATFKWVRAGNKHDPRYRPEGWAEWPREKRNSWHSGVDDALSRCGRIIHHG